MRTVIIKLISGEELIAKDLGADTYSRVRVLHMNHNGQAGLAPWVVLAPDADVNIKFGVVTVLDCPYEVEKMYLQATSGMDLSGGQGMILG